uniref:Evasin n=1 Tax=Rhipicephalus microplus TaxID=6941 RepID=A0A223FZ27_RHIMP|nr:evasin [Rhipicephalus microplus]
MHCLFWHTVLFAIIACSLGDPKAPANTGFVSCINLFWETSAGRTTIGCKHECKETKQVTNPGRQCLALSLEAQNKAKSGVNYTCTLGECDAELNCHPTELFIGCWKG